MLKILLISAISMLCVACGGSKQGDDNDVLYVSITPLKSIVEEVTCGDFDVRVLVPQGASPETFEPTAKQIADLNNSRLIFQTGLIDFEQSIIGRIDHSSAIVNLGEGIEPLSGCCAHHHNHEHGIDPHIWTAPRQLIRMVESVRDAIMREFPDSVKYSEAADRLQQRIVELDAYCNEQIESSGVAVMMIYHPAYTYYARDYGIEQLAIEHDGKEPSPRQLTSLVEAARANNIEAILLQPQYSQDKVLTIAEECGAEIIVTDPLAEDILSEIRRVTDIICRK